MSKIISRRARPHTVTLYNFVSSTNGVATYQRTVLKRVLLDTTYQKRLSQRGVTVSDTAQLIIDLRDISATSDRIFKDPVAWGLLTDKTGSFTFSPKTDFFVQGEVADTLPTETKGTMQKKHPVLSVTSLGTPASSSSATTIIEVLAQ